MNPFNFNVAMSDRRRFRRRAACSAAAVLLMLMFTVGFITVYVNTYNILYSTPMEVFSVEDNGGDIEVTVFNYCFSVKK